MTELPKRVLVLVNPKSGLTSTFNTMRRAIDQHWDRPGTEVHYQFTQSKDDGIAKTRRAVAAGVELVLVSGGDGTVNTIGRGLVGTDVTLGVIPSGSGNGFARHFGIPLATDRAVAALATGTARRIDVGVVDDKPFFVTCSMAWDASLVRSFERSPLRGIVPYVFAAVDEFFHYEAQDFFVQVDTEEEVALARPMVFTVANLTQFGGGAIIAPSAQHDDGLLELVVALRQDVPILLANLVRLFDHSLDRVPEVLTKRFRTLLVRREIPTAIQVDGELVPAGKEVRVSVRPAALSVLVPGA